MKLRKQGRLKVAGVVQRKDGGRPEIAYGRRAKDLEHAVQITELELLIGRIELPVKCGKAEPDGMFQGDAVELDFSGKENKKQWQGKLAKYPREETWILVVAMSEARMQRLRAWSESLKDWMVFSTFDRLRAGGQAWVDCQGNVTALGQ